MRATLRRSCNACAKAKHRCDLRTPHCSRCIKKKFNCIYANEPLTSSSPDRNDSPPSDAVGNGWPAVMNGVEVSKMTSRDGTTTPKFSETSVGLLNPGNAYFDPFDSYPPTRLPRVTAQRLIHHLRRKIADSSLAFQDETMNSVVTLAAIEHGKGNVESSRMHIDGIKRMVSVRGGINEVKGTSPLTARMVSWVSMLVTGAPQFQTQDDFGFGSGIGSIPQWQLAGLDSENMALDDLDVDPAMSNIISRLRAISHEPQLSRLTSTELHDLTCYVTHKLLLLPPLSPANPMRSAISECLRYALALYMLILHGTTYYSHEDLANTIMIHLKTHLEALARIKYDHGPLGIWAISMGMVAGVGTKDHQWFLNQARMAKIALGLQTWEDVLVSLESILWMRVEQLELFQEKWGDILKVTT
ncbi:hypothetical protein LSUB1_G005076 [Lachnellula subtilissima]|uniref:Zn(2)-C6 fungal-type domain-containing protein n=1 Tax=Lachnellula subtilissima TaxID=602034 RepID=A0A8H8U726_9HELO|nr:hypothetical protein LSUB1_G005076 [Lachnellula subtilissima]